MSATTGKASPPASRISRRVSVGSPVGRWLTPTSAPSDARRTAVARPMPLVAPVTSATLPVNRFSIDVPPSLPPGGGSEDGDRVPGRAGGSRQPERQANDHELPAALPPRRPPPDPRTGGCPRCTCPSPSAGGGGSGRAGLSTLLGTVSPSPSGRNAAMRRSCIHGIVSTCRARPFPRPRAAGRCARPEGQPPSVVARPEDQDVALIEADAFCLPRWPRARRGRPPRRVRATGCRDIEQRRAGLHGRRCRWRMPRCCPSPSRCDVRVDTGLPLYSWPR